MKRTGRIVIRGLTAALLLVVGVAVADDVPDRVAQLKAKADGRYRERLAAHKGHDHVLVLPGLIADRKTREIHIDAMATGLGKHDAIEFLLISPSSGNDYESLAVSFAEAGHVHKALMFIGLSQGQGVDFRKTRFWPKGERVRVTYRAPGAPPVPLERYVLDKQTGQPLPTSGFVFVGSRMVADPVQKDEKRYAADVYDPRSIVSIYNEADSVLDIPRRATQQDVYNRQFCNPDLLLPTNCLLEVVMTPAYTDGTARVADRVLQVAAGPRQTSFTLQLVAVDGGRTVQGGFPDILEEVRRLNEAGRDPFVSVVFDDALAIGPIRDVCAVIGAAETEKGMRIEPPAGKQLYYRAFLPNESFRDREARIAQPCELRLRREKDGIRGTVTRIHADWKGESLKPKLTLTHTDVPDPAALPGVLKATGLQVLLVFAPADLTYGELLRFIQPVRETHPLIHVFIDPPAQSADSAP